MKFSIIPILYMTAQIGTVENPTSARGVESSIQATQEMNLVPILVPEYITNKIKSRLPQSDFASVEDYASAVLASVLAELEKNGTDGQEKPEEEGGRVESKVVDDGAKNTAETEVFSQEDQENIEDRLRGLGYM